NRAGLLRGVAAAEAVHDEKINGRGSALHGDVAVVHAVDHAAVVAGDANAGLHRAADADIPEIDVVKIAGGFGAGLEAVAAGLEIAVQDVDVIARDLPAERPVALHADGIVGAAGEIAVVHLHVPATHEVDRIARFLHDDMINGDVLAVVEQVDEVA